jgi:hypothetical protein
VGVWRTAALETEFCGQAGSVVRLKQQLNAEEVRLPVRIDGGGRSTGGGLISRGHIYKILSNPIYVGRITHNGQVHAGRQAPSLFSDDVLMQPIRAGSKC